MADHNTEPKQENAFAFATLRTWVHLLRENKGVDIKYIGKLLKLLLISTFSLPFRIHERLKYGRIVNNTQIHPSPVFIIGHHRSGTTHLHNLLSQDYDFGFVSTFQATAAAFSITGNTSIKNELAKGLAKKRSMDNVEASLDAPQEEEIAVANLCPYSFMHHMSFPKKTIEYLEKYLLLENISPAELKKRNDFYLHVLKKATYLSNGKRLVLKGPINTGQIKNLLELFPDAQFIHIHRNPYHLFPSVGNLGRKLQPAHILQDISDDEGVDNIFAIYIRMMKKFLAEKHLIPKENFIEISYDDLDQNPLNTLALIYQQLNLPGFIEKKTVLENYIAQIGHYEKNNLPLETKHKKRINEECKFAFEEWQYPFEEV
jgi:omega-hydroxy-beta-dihydromenaquinone-9 sulfotransferase